MYLCRKQYEKVDFIFWEVEESMLYLEEGAYLIVLSLFNCMDIVVIFEEWEKVVVI